MSWPPAPRLVKPPRKRRAQPEAAVQKAMIEYLDLALPQPSDRYWWSATLNGVHLKSPRAIGRAKEQGLRPGLYDILLLKLAGPDAGATYWFEVKGPDGSLTPDQKRLMNVLWSAGRGASGKTVENLSAALVAWDFPVRVRI